ncbi:MAG: DUF4926 domain-containing protein [Bacteroidota bacterium]
MSTPSFEELDVIILTEAIPEYGLHAGDMGTIVLVYGDHEAYEVEFIDSAGYTVAVTTVQPSGIRHGREGEVPHMRTLERHHPDFPPTAGRSTT